MDSRQIIKQILYRLQNATYSASPNEKVFGTVSITDGFDEENLIDFRFPAAIIVLGDCRPDQENKQFQTFSIDVNILVNSMADGLGKGAILGAHFTPNSGSSAGRGLLDIYTTMADEALYQLEKLEGIFYFSGIRSNTFAERRTEGMRIHRMRSSYETYFFSQRSFSIVEQLTGVQDAADVDLAWVVPDRWDLLSMKVIRKTGSAPTSISDGTEVGDVSKVIGQNAYTLTDTGPTPGTYYYGVFAGYDDNEDGTADNYSNGTSVQVVVS